MKRIAAFLVITTMLIITSCGKSDRDLLKEDLVENGFSKEEAKE